MQPRIFLFLIDGMGSHFVKPMTSPFLHQHMIGTMQNVLPPWTCTNWITFLTGKTPHIHGVVNNEQVEEKNYVQPLTTICNDFGVQNCLLISDWKSCRKLIDSSISFEYVKRDVIENSIDLWEKHSRPLFTIINFETLDHIAHKKGWGSKEYNQELKLIDQRMQWFAKQIAEKTKNKFQIFVVSDHGGIEKEHDDNKKQIRSVPLIMIPRKELQNLKLPGKTNQFRKFVKRVVFL